MSVRPEPTSPESPSLSGSEGALISVTISVEPRLLEQLLEALADIRFPINPQIYHNATVTQVYPDGREVVDPTTIVEFPAYEGRLQEVRELLEQRGFDPAAVWSKNLLDEIHSAFDAEPAQPGKPYTMVVRRKHPEVAC